MNFCLLAARKLWDSRFIPFLIAGGINTLFSYLLFAFFIYVGVHYAFATFLATTITIAFGYHTTRKAFQTKGYQVLLKFISICIFLYFLTVLSIKILHQLTHNYYLDGLLTTLFIPLISFYLNKAFVFRKKTPH